MLPLSRACRLTCALQLSLLGSEYSSSVGTPRVRKIFEREVRRWRGSASLLAHQLLQGQGASAG